MKKIRERHCLKNSDVLQVMLLKFNSMMMNKVSVTTNNNIM